MDEVEGAFWLVATQTLSVLLLITPKQLSPGNSVTVMGKTESKSYFGAILSHCFSITNKKKTFTSVLVASKYVYLTALQSPSFQWIVVNYPSDS